MEKKRHLYIEALRFLACLAVIFNHSPRSSYFLFTEREVGSSLYFFDLTVSISCKFAVPVFLAISGALMLDREISYKKLWTRRIPKNVLMLFVFSLLSYLAGIAAGREAFDLKTFIFRAYDKHHNYAYWYLYAYIGFLIASPLLSAMVRHLRTGELVYLLGAALLFRCVIPAAEQLRWAGEHQLNSNLSPVWLTADIVFYPVIGYVLHHRADMKTLRKLLPLLWLAAAAGLHASCMLTFQEWHQRWVTHIETYHELFAGVYCAAVFATVRVLYAHVPEDGRLARVTAALGGCTLGVYLIHVPVMDYTRFFQETVWIPMDALHLPQLVCGAIYILILFFACAAVTWAMKKIPGLKWLLK